MKEHIKRQIKAHALETPSLECCGLLIASHKDKSLEIVRSPNLAEEKHHRFSLSSSHYLKASLAGDIIAIYHSHPEGEDFSEFDLVNSELNKIKYILYCVKSNTFKDYVPNGYTNPYYGREFHLGKQDCYSLGIEYYKKELNIDLKNYHRDYDWSRDNPNSYLERHENEGFKIIFKGVVEDLSILKKHDAILMKLLGKKNPTHAGIYMGGGLILHHQLNCYSRIEEYSQIFRNRTTHILRHESLL